ncbi:MAG TPA: hypothetical protein DFR83_10810 [Deltaproteobacteria bacterium]|nr:hypothetical protein [Deltaproteobacteria bacterium]
MKPNWFIGWPATLPAEWLADLAPPPRFRVFHPGDLHATIAFLGGVSESAARHAWATLPPILGGPFEATWGGIVAMGPPRRYSALAAELDTPTRALRAQMATLQPKLLGAAGARPARHPPRPHVTIARPQRRASEAQRARGLEWAAGLTLPVLTTPIDKVALFTWSANRKERLFQIVEERALG